MAPPEFSSSPERDELTELTVSDILRSNHDDMAFSMAHELTAPQIYNYINHLQADIIRKQKEMEAAQRELSEAQVALASAQQALQIRQGDDLGA